MGRSQNFPNKGKVGVDESYVGGQDDEALGRNEGKKKIMVVGIERGLGGVSRWYERVIETASKFNLRGFMTDHIREKSGKKGENYKAMHRVFMIYKA